LSKVRQLGLVLAVALLSTSVFAAEIAVLRNGFSIRHERREVVEQNTRLYVSPGQGGWIDVPTSQIESFEKDTTPPPQPALPPQPVDVHKVVSAASDKHRIDADLISSVIRAESGFNQRAVSRKGAQGLMQLMPGTASRLGVADAFDAEANVDGGTRYLRELLLKYQGDLVKALAAYNAGPRRVEQYKGVPPYRETHAYVSRIIRDFNRKKLAEKAKKPAAASRPLSGPQTPGR
jgi:soluble lytic murein transglycosylase-like protein